MKNNEMYLEFDSNSANEAFARVAVAAFVAQLNPTLEEIADIKTAVSEAVTNAIIHGYNYDKDKKVYMSLEVIDRHITLIIEDHGFGIEDIEKVRIPFYTSKANIEHAGMGLTIIDTLCDVFEIESEVEKGTKLIIKKELKKHEHV